MKRSDMLTIYAFIAFVGCAATVSPHISYNWAVVIGSLWFVGAMTAIFGSIVSKDK